MLYAARKPSPAQAFVHLLDEYPNTCYMYPTLGIGRASSRGGRGTKGGTNVSKQDLKPSRQSFQQGRGLSVMQITLVGIINRNPNKAYGTALTKEIQPLFGEDISDAQIYMTLKRLEQRGLIESPNIVPEPSIRGRGRPRRLYVTTETGRRVLEDAESIASAVGSSTSRKGDSDNGQKEEGHFTPLVV